MVIQTDGVVLYSTIMDEIGGNIFSHPDYQDPKHRIQFTRIAAESSGMSSYRSSYPDHENGSLPGPPPALMVLLGVLSFPG